MCIYLYLYINEYVYVYICICAHLSYLIFYYLPVFKLGYRLVEADKRNGCIFQHKMSQDVMAYVNHNLFFQSFSRTLLYGLHK